MFLLFSRYLPESFLWKLCQSVNCSQGPAQDWDDLGEDPAFLSASRVLYISSIIFKNEILKGHLLLLS